MFAVGDIVTFSISGLIRVDLRSSAAKFFVLIRLYPCSSVANSFEFAQNLLGRPFITPINLNEFAIWPD